MSDYRLRITKCYLVEVVDKDGYVQEHDFGYGDEVMDEFVFGSKEEATKVGKRMIKRLKEVENE